MLNAYAFILIIYVMQDTCLEDAIIAYYKAPKTFMQLHRPSYAFIDFQVPSKRATQ